MGILYILSKLSLAAAFTYSSVTKIRNPRALVEHMTATIKLPSPLLWAATASVMIGELVSVLALLTTDRLGFAISTVLLTVFTGYLATIIHRGQEITCSCAGASETIVSTTHIARNSLLLLLAVAGVLLDPVAFAHHWNYYLMVLGPAALIGIGLLHFAEIVQFFTFD